MPCQHIGNLLMTQQYLNSGLLNLIIRCWQIMSLIKLTKKLVFPAYSIKEIGGLRIGLIGIASNIVDKTMPPSFSEGIYFTLGKDELPPIIDLLRNKEKVDLIVLISHLGFAQDMKLYLKYKALMFVSAAIPITGFTNRFSVEKQLLYNQAVMVLFWVA
jgi:2',3'-cyclic-nucleotide 2'-phosphodiesterase (5'-nucleotidase family)